MRKLIYRVFLSFAFAITAHLSLAQDTIHPNIPIQHRLWQEANSAYTATNYNEAIDLYHEILSLGMESYKLYYNLGNAYFKENNIAMAIVNYKRAQRLAPSNSDIAHNLAIADGLTVNRIEALPEFILNKLFKQVRGVMSSNNWAILSIAFFALMLMLVMFYLLSNTPFKRKVGFTGAVFALLFFVVSVIFSSQLRTLNVYSTEAVVLSSAEAVKSSPNQTGKDMFIINEGSVVHVLDKLGDWSEIVIASGNKGWIRSSAIEVI